MVTTSKTLRSASIMAKFPVNSLFFPVLDGFQPRPDSSKLRHPPPSLPNCGPAETGGIFRAVGAGFGRGRWHQRRARRAERASLSVLVSNPDFRVPRLRPIGERALKGPCGGEKEATREAQNRGPGYRGVAALVPCIRKN